MVSALQAFALSKITILVGGSIAVFLAGWVLKKIPNARIKAAVGKFFYGVGVTITLGLAKWKYTAPVWNKVIEPWVIDLIDNVVGEAVKQLINGMRVDNTEKD